MSFSAHTRIFRSLMLFIFGAFITGCTLQNLPMPPETLLATAAPQLATLTAPTDPTPQDTGATPTPTPALSPHGWSDENAMMAGVCFEAALDAAGQTFVLNNASALIRFYDLADNSKLCRQSIQRALYDFAGGSRMLAGLWSVGKGCNARHDVQTVLRDDDAQQFYVSLKFITEGDCPYELVRPFWIGLENMNDYKVQIVVLGN